MRLHAPAAGASAGVLWLVLVVAAGLAGAEVIAAAETRAPAAPRPPGERRDAPGGPSPQVLLDSDHDAVRFAIIGDSGTGSRGQRAIAAQMVAVHERFPFEFVLMLGDNLYGGEGAGDFQKKFEEPYRPLLDDGVKFRAALGNHDRAVQREYKGFNMDGKRYYSFTAEHQSVRFYALDSNYMDPEQLDWVKRALHKDDEKWKICFFHHPLYSSGKRHGPDLALRAALEVPFVEGGVDLVLAGHEHFYERLVPQNGIAYFIAGSAAKLRSGGIRPTPATAKGFDRGLAFLIASIKGDELRFQAIDDRGRTVDSGRILRRERGGEGQGKGDVAVLPLVTSEMGGVAAGEAAPAGGTKR